MTNARSELRKVCHAGGDLGCSCADRNYQWFDHACREQIVTAFKNMLSAQANRAAPAPDDARGELADQIDAANKRLIRQTCDTSHWSELTKTQKGLANLLWVNKDAIVSYLRRKSRPAEPEIDLLAKRLAGAELNYRNAYERNNDHINTGRMWDKMRRAGDAIRQYFHEREESPDPGTEAVASAEESK